MKNIYTKMILNIKLIMPCSICHQKGHNKKTHYKLYPNEKVSHDIQMNESNECNEIKLKNIETPVQCCICMEDIKKQHNYCITKCGHEFCLDCMANNINHNNNTCPLCRSEIVKKRTDPFKMTPIMADSILSSALSKTMPECREIIFANRVKYSNKIVKEFKKILSKMDSLNKNEKGKDIINETINGLKKITHDNLYYHEDELKEKLMINNVTNNIRILKTCSILYEDINDNRVSNREGQVEWIESVMNHMINDMS